MEASLQEAVLDQIDHLVLAKAVAAAGSNANGPTPAAATAAEALCSILQALVPGAAARVSLSRALESMAAKKRLKGDKAAQGLQNIICGLGAGRLAPVLTVPGF